MTARGLFKHGQIKSKFPIWLSLEMHIQYTAESLGKQGLHDSLAASSSNTTLY